MALKGVVGGGVASGGGGGGMSSGVTSVALAAPAEFITGPPVTSSGTLSFDWSGNPVDVANGGTGLSSTTPNAILQAGAGSTSPLNQIALLNLGSSFLNSAGAFAVPPAQPIQPNLSSTFLNGQGAFSVPPYPAGGGAGTVSSVGLQLTSEFNITGSPVTNAGTLMASFAFQNANFIFGGPGVGTPFTPAFRALVNADLPVAISGKNFTSSTYAKPNITTQTLTDAAPVAWNMNSGTAALLTPSSNRTLSTVANLPMNGTAILKIIQGGTGLAMSYVSQFKFPGGTKPTLSSCPGQVDILSLYSDGTFLFGTALTNML